MTIAPVSDTLLIDRFGTLPDGTPVERIRLRSAQGLDVAILSLGAAVQALHAPDRNGVPADIVLGHDTLAPYLSDRRFFGATVGRVVVASKTMLSSVPLM